MRSERVHNTLLNQTTLTHYRVPFVSSLANHPKITLTVAAGITNYGLTSSRSTDVPGANIVTVDNLWIWGRTFLFQPRVLVLFRKYDVVILPFNLRTVSTAAVLVLSKIMHRPVILWGHASGQSTSRWVRLVRKFFARLASAVVVYSDGNRDELVSLGVERAKVFVAPNSIDVESIVALRDMSIADRVSMNGVRRILFCGRLISIKKVDLLLRAFKLALPKLPPDVELTIIGDGPEAPQLKDLANRLDIGSRIEFTGTVTDEFELSKYFLTALFVANPGHIGLLAIHSLAYGCPILVADADPHAPEFEALVPNFNCLLFSSDSDASMAEGMCRLVRDESLRSKLSEAAKSSGDHYGVSKMVEAFVDAIDYSTEGC